MQMMSTPKSLVRVSAVTVRPLSTPERSSPMQRWPSRRRKRTRRSPSGFACGLTGNSRGRNAPCARPLGVDSRNRLPRCDARA